MLRGYLCYLCSKILPNCHWVNVAWFLEFASAHYQTSAIHSWHHGAPDEEVVRRLWIWGLENLRYSPRDAISYVHRENDEISAVWKSRTWEKLWILGGIPVSHREVWWTKRRVFWRQMSHRKVTTEFGRFPQNVVNLVLDISGVKMF